MFETIYIGKTQYQRIIHRLTGYAIPEDLARLKQPLMRATSMGSKTIAIDSDTLSILVPHKLLLRDLIRLDSGLSHVAEAVAAKGDPSHVEEKAAPSGGDPIRVDTIKPDKQTRTRSISLTDDEASALKTLGRTNLTRGVRVALEVCRRFGYV